MQTERPSPQPKNDVAVFLRFIPSEAAIVL